MDDRAALQGLIDVNWGSSEYVAVNPVNPPLQRDKGF